MHTSQRTQSARSSPCRTHAAYAAGTVRRAERRPSRRGRRRTCPCVRARASRNANRDVGCVCVSMCVSMCACLCVHGCMCLWVPAGSCLRVRLSARARALTASLRARALRGRAGRTGAQRLRVRLGFDGANVTVKVDAASEGVPVAPKRVVRERLNASVCPVRGGRRNLARARIVEPKEARRAGFADGVAQRERCAQHATSATAQRTCESTLCAFLRLKRACARSGCHARLRERCVAMLMPVPTGPSPPHSMLQRRRWCASRCARNSPYRSKG